MGNLSTRLAGEGRAFVLVVEDDDDLRMALTHGLEAEGFTVDAVASASAAYERVGESRPDLVLLDWWLGEGEMGAAACRRLAEDAGLHVVMHTGMSDARDRAAAFRAGAVGYLQKGMPLEELAERLRRVLEEVE
ncbi:MAG TPA: response regulator [Solirubrobacteraceae bacterium]|nr:response regulator [Solirubrobacteraceae bacterium]